MATIRSYSAVFEQTTVANAAVTRWRFNEAADATIALDSVDGHEGSYEPGAAPGDAGTIGDGAARFDGLTGRVLVADTLTGTITVSGLGDSLIDGDHIPVASDRFSPNLETALEARGLVATVRDRAEGGQRTGDALAPRQDRFVTVEEVLADDPTPDVVILVLGTNDAIGEVDPDTVEANLREIISDLQAGGVEEILLTGTFGFYPERTSASRGYDTQELRAAFEGTFATIANDTPGVTLLNDTEGSDKFLGGARIEGDPDISADDVIQGGVLNDGDTTLNVGDGLHPNAAGVDLIVERVLPQTVALGAAAGVLSDALELASGSIELWFTPDSVMGTQTLFSKNGPGPNQGDIEISLVGDAVAVVMENASNTFQARGGTVARDEAAHVVFKFGANGMELYVDGALEASNPFTGGLTGNLEELGIGARADGSEAFDGVIDEVAVYDRALTVGEIQQLFVGGELGTSVLATANADTILGGSDDEVLRGAGGADAILARGGDDALRGGDGGDDLRGGSGDDRLFGGGGADDLSGAGGDDRLLGHGRKDNLAGGADADRLFGGRAIDHLSGGAGDDLLNGGRGRDSLIGGPDADTFEIDRLKDGIDRVRDFAPGEGDVLDLSAVLDLSGGGDANDFVQLDEINGHTEVDVDPNGAGGDFTTVFRLTGTTGLDLDSLVAGGNVQLEPPPTS
jgi:lysophospholipase L1-like esterase